MGLVDILIVIFICLGGFVGYRRGVIKELVTACGLFIVVVLSFFLKNPISILLYENLPFFKFGGIFKGVTAINIILYEFIAFLIAFLILMFLWKIVIFASSLIQRIINYSFLLGIPSKILGTIIGLIEYYFICFIVVYVLVLPLFSIKEVVESKYAQFILNNTPVISGFVSENSSFIDEFASLKEKYENAPSANEFNYEALDLFLKYDIININSAKRLHDKDKLKIDGIDELIKKYEEEK